MAKRREVRRRQAIAVASSLLGHLVVIAFMASELDRTGPPPAPAEAVTATLMPWPPSEPSHTADVEPTFEPPRASASQAQPAVAAGPLPSGNGTTPAVAEAGARPPPLSSPAQGPLRTGCIGKRTNGREEEIDCTLEKWRLASGRVTQEAPGDTIPDDKRTQYATVARRQARQRAPVSQLGNATTIGCHFGNLGAACLDEMLIPLLGPKADK